jgi:beta-glucosidase
MREACHHNLYALANSSGMNGLGPDTTVQSVRPGILTGLLAAAVLCAALAAVGGALWFRGSQRLRATEEYAAWKAWKQSRRG